MIYELGEAQRGSTWRAVDPPWMMYQWSGREWMVGIHPMMAMPVRAYGQVDGVIRRSTGYTEMQSNE